MNYQESIKTTINALRKFEPGQEVISILEDFANDEMDNFVEGKPRSIEDKLNDLRSRYESGNQPSTMNLYPSNKKDSCHPFCLAIANKKFDKPRKGLESGFKGLMLEMAAFWFSCLSVNKKTLILTCHWDNDIFDEYYKNIIDQYTRVHEKTVFIVEVGPTGFFPRYPY